MCGKFLVKYAKMHIDNNLTSLIMKPCDGYVYIYMHMCILDHDYVMGSTLW